MVHIIIGLIAFAAIFGGVLIGFLAGRRLPGHQLSSETQSAVTVSVAVIGLYLAFAIPIFLRWRHGDRFEVGSWNNGNKYKWMNPIAVAEIVIISIYFILPLYPSGWIGNENFDWKFVNYAPILTFGTLAVVAIWWQLSAKNWFTGPKHTIDEAVVQAFED